MPKYARHEFPVDGNVLAAFAVEGTDPDLMVEVANLLSMRGNLRNMVTEAVDSLSERSRTIIEGLYYEGCSLEELAARFGVGHRSTICRWHKVALAELKKKLEGTECPVIWRRYCVAKAPRGRCQSRS